MANGNTRGGFLGFGLFPEVEPIVDLGTALFGPPEGPVGTFQFDIAEEDLAFLDSLPNEMGQAIKQYILEHPEQLLEAFDIAQNFQQFQDLNQQIEDDRDRVNAFITDNQQRLTDFEQQTRPLLESNVRRFTGGDLGGQLQRDFIFTDPEFAGALSSAENAIAANIDRVRRNAAVTNAAAGVRQSGKGQTQVGQAESLAALGRAQTRNQLFGTARSGLESAQNQLTSFNQFLPEARTAIDLGFAPQFPALTSGQASLQPPDPFSLTSTGVDLTLGQAGLDQNSFANFLQTAQLGNQIGQQGFENIRGLVPALNR